MVEIVYIDQNKFLRDMVEYSVKADGGTAFTLDNAIDQRAIIEDLTPQLVVLDLKTCSAELEYLTADSTLKFLAIGEETDQALFAEFAHLFIGMEEKPLDPVNLRQRFLDYLEE